MHSSHSSRHSQSRSHTATVNSMIDNDSNATAADSVTPTAAPPPARAALTRAGSLRSQTNSVTFHSATPTQNGHHGGQRRAASPSTSQPRIYHAEESDNLQYNGSHTNENSRPHSPHSEVESQYQHPQERQYHQHGSTTPSRVQQQHSQYQSPQYHHGDPSRSATPSAIQTAVKQQQQPFSFRSSSPSLSQTYPSSSPVVATYNPNAPILAIHPSSSPRASPKASPRGSPTPNHAMQQQRFAVTTPNGSSHPPPPFSPNKIVRPLAVTAASTPTSPAQNVSASPPATVPHPSSYRSSSPAPVHSCAPTTSTALAWVSHSNRELVRTAFSKRTTVHRGILETRYPVTQDSAHVAPVVKKSSSSSSSSSSSAASSTSSLHTTLLQSSPSRSFHITVYGTSGCGKTATLHNLTQRTIPQKHVESHGMELLDLAWPYKLTAAPLTMNSNSNDIILCDFLFWDLGTSSSSQYKYLQTTSSSHSQCILYVISQTDKNSWQYVKKKLEDEDREKMEGKILVVTKIDDRQKREVQESELIQFQEKYNQYYSSSLPVDLVNAATASSSVSITSATSPSSSNSPRTQSTYVPGSLVICKLANLPISNEPFYTRPGVSSLLNTIAAMCCASVR